MLDAVFHRFVDQSTVTVMVGGLLERVLTPEKLDACVHLQRGASLYLKL